MPTGYTTAIYEGKEQSVEDFILRCARAMGACIMQRDDPFDDPPKKQYPCDYNAKRLIEAKQELDRLQAMSESQINEEARKERKDKIDERIKHDKIALELRGRYQNMLYAVEGWQPPTPDHKGLKEFMIEQLKTSINFDCSTGWPEIPPVITAEEWRQKKIQQTIRDIAYHTKENQKEIERTKGRNRWISQLYVSLGREPL